MGDITLTASVGKNAKNKVNDVMAVQLLLNKFITANLLELLPLVPNGRCDAKTIGAIREFQRRIVGMSSPDGRVDPNRITLKALNAAPKRPGSGDPRPSQAPAAAGPASEIHFSRHRIIDLTHEQDGVALRRASPRKVRVTGGRIVQRDPPTIDCICYHQTAARFGVSAAQVKAAGGDRDLALHRRALRAGYHVLAFRTGKAVHSAPWLWYVNHGNKLNARSIGIGTDGLYEGVEGNPRTVSHGKTPTELTEETIEAARAAIAYTVASARAAGCPIRWIWAHRQSSANRRNDPGSALWRHVVLDYAVSVLGLEMQPAATWDKGRPIPVEWDPQEGVGRY